MGKKMGLILVAVASRSPQLLLFTLRLRPPDQYFYFPAPRYACKAEVPSRLQGCALGYPLNGRIRVPSSGRL